MQDLKIIKIGGQVVEDKEKLHQAIAGFCTLKMPKILVHGGGTMATQFSEQLGLEPQLIDGRRVTDAESLKVVQMVYAGLINKNIVAQLQAMNCPSVGLSGADANCILAEKRPVKKIDYGYVGDIIEVNTKTIIDFFEIGVAPVFCALSHDGRGQILNTNADTIATELGIALSKSFIVNIVYCFDKSGLLGDIKDNSTVVNHVVPATYANLRRKGMISDGMIPKMDNAFRALNAGVQNVYIIHYNSLGKLFKEGESTGTKISLN